MHGQCCSQVSRREQLGSKAKGEQARKEKGELRKQAAKAAPVGDSEEVEVEERVDEPEKKVQKSRKKARARPSERGRRLWMMMMKMPSCPRQWWISSTRWMS